MKRSQVNQAVKQAIETFELNGWVLPAKPLWDVTDFGLGNFEKEGLILINLAEEAEYCEKLMLAFKDQVTPAHYHKRKKEDIIARKGALAVQLWSRDPDQPEGPKFTVRISGQVVDVHHGQIIEVPAGERITLVPGIWHAFWPTTPYCIIGEVSTANDDTNDNFFLNPEIGRYSAIEEDEAPVVKLVSDKQ